MVKFMFSGPTKAWCPLEAEKNAVIYLYKEAKFFSHGTGRFIISSDSMTLVQMFKRKEWDGMQDKMIISGVL